MRFLVPGFRSGQRKAFFDEAANILVLHAAVENYANPMFLIHMICGDHGGKSSSPEIGPHGLRFYIDPDMSFPLEDQRKDLLVAPMAHCCPIGVVKGIILISTRQPEAGGDGVCAGCQEKNTSFCFIFYLRPELLKLFHPPGKNRIARSALP